MTAFILIVSAAMFGAISVTGYVIALAYIGWLYVPNLPGFCRHLLMLCFSSSLISFLYLSTVLR